MDLGGLATGSSVFVDANTLVYHFSSQAKFGLACKQFIERVAQQEVTAFSSSHVASDVAHRMMTIEAIELLGWPLTGIAQRLKRYPAEIARLSKFRQALDEIPQLGIHLIPVSHAMVAKAAAISQQFGLLSGDALVVAGMQDLQLESLVSSDSDFDRVPWLKRFFPS